LYIVITQGYVRLKIYQKIEKIIYPERINLAFGVLENNIYRQFPGLDYLGYCLKILL